MTKDSIICKKCSLSVDARVDLFTVCEGDCSMTFHSTCVSLSESDILALKANIIWLCDDCMGIFRRARDNRVCREGIAAGTNNDIAHSGTNGTKGKTIEDEVHELKDAVSEIRHTIAKIVHVGSTGDPPVLHSTPVSSIKLLDGTNRTNACDTTTRNDEGLRQQCAAMDERNFSLLLTNIDTSVAEWEVHRMVAQALGSAVDPEHLDVIKLVPQWRNHSSMDFVSYKVVLDNRLKAKAMDPSTWPKGVRFREFVRKRFATWRPT